MTDLLYFYLNFRTLFGVFLATLIILNVLGKNNMVDNESNFFAYSLLILFLFDTILSFVYLIDFLE